MAFSQRTPWPPSLPIDQLDKLRSLAITYALANGLVLKPVIPSPETAIHAPFALFPSPFPRDGFEKALRIQTSYNKLYAHLSNNSEFLKQVIGKLVSSTTSTTSTSSTTPTATITTRNVVDPFIEKLYKIWFKLDSMRLGSKISLGIFRSDYLLHQDISSSSSSSSDNNNNKNNNHNHNHHHPVTEIKQVEFNTISVSFAGLGTKVSGLHRYLATTTDAYSASNLPHPPNHGLSSLCKGLLVAHETYRSTFSSEGPLLILMITQANERNVFDQALLVHALAEQGDGVRMVRLSCHDILTATELDQSTCRLFYLENGQRTEVSVVYYRSMYGPEDFLSDQDWQGREQLERSRAINCPNLATQLVGCKKVQQVLTDSSSLLLPGGQLNLEEILSDIELNELRSTWMPIYTLDDQALQIASDPLSASRFVLKPQREGGGHNIYGPRIPEYLAGLTKEERQGYILMQLIQTPAGIHNILVRPFPNPSSSSTQPAEIVSELGVLGVCLYKKAEQGKLEMLWNTQAGHFLRTKNSESDEGGVAVGVSCLDSPYLV